MDHPYQAPQTLDPAPSSLPASETLGFLREIVTDSLRFWEGRRLVYNGVLALGSLAAFVLTGLPGGMLGLLSIAFMGLPANLLYCAVYPLDLILQVSHFRDPWRRFRFLVFLAGLGLAGLLALGFLSILASTPLP